MVEIPPGRIFDVFGCRVSDGTEICIFTGHVSGSRMDRERLCKSASLAYLLGFLGVMGKSARPLRVFIDSSFPGL